jgi:hypothetical protein
MWVERRSSQSTPSQTPPQSRPYSPAQRRPQGPGPLPPRPSLNPRDTSLSLLSTPNISVTHLPANARIPAGSSLRNEIRNPTPDNVADPLDVLSNILGKPSRSKSTNGDDRDMKIPTELVADIDFEGLSLEDFVKQGSIQEEKVPDVHSYTTRSIEECTSNSSLFLANLLMPPQMTKRKRSLKIFTNLLPYAQATYDNDGMLTSTGMRPSTAVSRDISHRLPSRSWNSLRRD